MRPACVDVDVVARINGFAGFITGQMQPVIVKITVVGGALSLNGRASTAGDVVGRMVLKLSDTEKFLRSVGVGGAELPRGLGRTVDMEADVTMTSDCRLSLSELTADLGSNTVTGAVDISLNGTPQINAQLRADALDLTGATQGDASRAVLDHHLRLLWGQVGPRPALMPQVWRRLMARSR